MTCDNGLGQTLFIILKRLHFAKTCEYQSQRSEPAVSGVLQKSCYEKFRKIHWKTQVSESHFNKVALSYFLKRGQITGVSLLILQTISEQQIADYSGKTASGIREINGLRE